MASDRGIVVVIKNYEFSEAKVASQRTGLGKRAFSNLSSFSVKAVVHLGSDALLHAPIAGEYVRVVIEYIEVRFVVSCCKMGFCNGHSDSIADALSERTSTDLNAGRTVSLRMSWRSRQILAPINTINFSDLVYSSQMFSA